MKIFIINFFTMVLYSLIFFSPLCLAEENPESMEFCYMDFDKRPYWNVKKEGLDLDLVRKAGEELGVKVIVTPMPWRRCHKNLGSNNISGLIGSSFQKSRMKIGQYPLKPNGELDNSFALHVDGYTFYKLKGDPVYWDGNQLVGLTGRVGANSGFSIVDKLKNKGIKVYDAAKTTAQNFSLMGIGRYQVIVDSGIRADYFIKTTPGLQSKFEKIHKPYDRSGRYLIFSHGFYQKHPIFAEKFWITVKKIRESEEFQETLKNALK